MAAKKPSKKQNASQICIVTVTGTDKVGIIARISVAMTQSKINIVDVNQKIMEDQFVMTMACDMNNARASMQEVQNQLREIADEMELRITFQHEDLFKAMHRI